MKTFDVSGEGIYTHVIGEDTCRICFGRDFPLKCKCGGLVHSDFGDEDSDCNYWLYKKCDRCGEDYDLGEGG